MWNGTMFVDLDWPLNASSLLSASAELLVNRYTVLHNRNQYRWCNLVHFLHRIVKLNNSQIIDVIDAIKSFIGAGPSEQRHLTRTVTNWSLNGSASPCSGRTTKSWPIMCLHWVSRDKNFIVVTLQYCSWTSNVRCWNSSTYKVTT